MEEGYRHEQKYAISPGDHAMLRSRLRAVMAPDPHAGPAGCYRITSLYFDNYRDKALREKLDGVRQREKFRIRYYDGDLNTLHLEKKQKCGSLGQKFSAPLTAEDCRRILDGDWGFLLEREDMLLREFYVKLRCQLLRPKVVVIYEREPWVYAPGNVRVTFDQNIRSGLYNTDFLTPGAVLKGVSPAEGEILEVKYDRFLPGIIQELLQLGHRRVQAFSKFAACRLAV